MRLQIATNWTPVTSLFFFKHGGLSTLGYCRNMEVDSTWKRTRSGPLMTTKNLTKTDFTPTKFSHIHSAVMIAGLVVFTLYWIELVNWSWCWSKQSKSDIDSSNFTVIWIIDLIILSWLERYSCPDRPLIWAWHRTVATVAILPQPVMHELICKKANMHRRSGSSSPEKGACFFCVYCKRPEQLTLR